MKLISNKDGCSGDRGASFSGYCPNSYRVENDAGVEVGEFIQMKDARFPRANVTAWVGMGQRFGYLSQVRQYINTNGNTVGSFQIS
tara:strand:- start:1916 stop:2173 length:258 start_codon:yes stop_codon:yes gene_type:complete